MLHAVIMAGGFGTRFWPESRAGLPKQLLPLAGERTMLQATVDRLQGLVPSQRILIVTNERLVAPIVEQLPDLPTGAVLGEPCRRDTAPCIGLAALAISRDDPEATMVVLPADHVIQPEEAFRDALRIAADLVEQRPERIVTFGIRPTWPAINYGYIERGVPLSSAEVQGEHQAFQVRKFREKPKVETAREYLETGNFYWNAGIFIWKAKTILHALQTHQPDMYEHLSAIDAARGRPDYETVLRREFEAIRPVSVDYAVMEHATDVVVIEAPFRWDDVGSWQAVARLRGVDADENTVVGKHVGLRTSGTIVYGGQDHLIVTLGLKDCLVVHTPDATLIANKHDEEAIKEVVKRLEASGWTEYL